MILEVNPHMPMQRQDNNIIAMVIRLIMAVMNIMRRYTMGGKNGNI